MKGETTEPPPPGAPSRLSPLGEVLRRHDRDRYQTALFAPAARREALFALYAFNYEVARVRETVTQPMLGQIRLQWWREAIAAAFAGAPPRQHAVALPLSEIIRDFRLSRACFDRLVDSRERDLADEPPTSLADLEDYAAGTSATLVALAWSVLGGARDAASGAVRGVGIGYALAGLLRAMPFHARAGRSYIPADIAFRTGLDPADYSAGRGTPALRAAVTEVAAAAAGHLRAARAQRAAIPRAALAAMLPAVMADRYLVRLARAGCDPFAAALAAPDPWQIWRLAAAALRRRF